MPSPQYNPRRQHREPPKKVKRSGASPARGDSLRVDIPWWLWIVVGTALGVFVSFLLRLAQAPAQMPAAAVAVQKTSKENMPEEKISGKNARPVVEQKTVDKPAVVTDDKNAKAGDEGSPKPDETKTVTKFDFYTLLPEREVIVPNDREAMKATEKPQVAGEQDAVTEADQLLLQAGSFRSALEAERRRTKIKTLGLNAKVEEVIANSDTWYRVQAGPFTSREQLSKAREQLKAEGIESLLLRQK